MQQGGYGSSIRVGNCSLRGYIRTLWQDNTGRPFVAKLIHLGRLLSFTIPYSIQRFVSAPRIHTLSLPTAIIYHISRLSRFTSVIEPRAMDNSKLNTSKDTQLQGRGGVYDNTINKRPVPHDEPVARNPGYGTVIPGRATSDNHDVSRRVKTAAATEIGDPQGRIPSADQTREQLAAANKSQLPVDASRSASTHPIRDSSIPLASREHRKSNYAPGYEQAFDVVPQKYYDADGHEPTFLPHEKLGSGNCG